MYRVLIAHAEDDVGGHAAVLNRDRGGPPVLRTVHHVAAHDDPDLEELQRASIADADLCATATAHWARRVDELFGVTATVVRNGVNAERFLAAAGASAVAEGRPVVLTMGGIERRKGSRVLLEAFARARRRLGGHPLLLVAGASGGEERYRSAWAEDADRLGLRVGDGADDAIDVRLVGAVADGDLPRLIAGADVHVVASTREGSSLAVLEAACAGVPSVVTDLPALREELADGRDCLMVDDIVDSAGTLCNAAEALKEKGAKSVSAYVTHGVLSGGAVARVEASPLEQLVITDSIQATEAVRVSRKIEQLTIAPLLGEAMSRIAYERSVSSLFD